MPSTQSSVHGSSRHGAWVDPGQDPDGEFSGPESASAAPTAFGEGMLLRSKYVGGFLKGKEAKEKKL